MTGYKNLFEFAAEFGATLNSLYKGNANDRTNIITFMDANDWFDIDYIMKDRVPWVS